jgi:hypothetical protein
MYSFKSFRPVRETFEQVHPDSDGAALVRLMLRLADRLAAKPKSKEVAGEASPAQDALQVG